MTETPGLHESALIAHQTHAVPHINCEWCPLPDADQIAIKEAQHKGWQLGYTEAWNNARNGDLPSRPPLDDAGKPWPEEPTGDVLAALGGALYRRVEDGSWASVVNGYRRTWQELLDYWPNLHLVVYRNEAELGNPAEWARLDEANALEDARPVHHDHVSLAVVLRVLDGVREASITATEQEAVRRCHTAVMKLPTYVGCWP